MTFKKCQCGRDIKIGTIAARGSSAIDQIRAARFGEEKLSSKEFDHLVKVVHCKPPCKICDSVFAKLRRFRDELF